jgi:hypothetical protein
MPAKQPSIGVDSFELAQELHARGRRTWMLLLLSFSTTILAVFALVLQAAKPIPVVVWSDDPNRPAQVFIAAPGEALVREVDAKRFMVRAGDALMAWNSGTVTDELNKALLLMTPRWRNVFEDQLNAKVSVPVELDPSGKMTTYGTYLAAKVRNSVEWDWSTAKCVKAEGVWNCKANAVVETQPLIGAPLTSPDAKRRIEVQAQFIEVPVTANSIDGLLVEFWNQVDPK